MPVLLLAKGDQESKNRLRRALEARYGIGAPTLETIKITFRGRARVSRFWLRIETTVYLSLPNRVRWEFTLRPLGLPLLKGYEAFDGQRYHHSRGVGKNTEQHVASIRARAWAVSAALIAPLNAPTVEVRAHHAYDLIATNNALDTEVILCLSADGTLDRVIVSALRHMTGSVEQFSIVTVGGYALFDDFILPKALTILWNDEPSVEVQPIALAINEPLPDALFSS